MFDKETTIKVANKVIKKFEGCELRAYPDPVSELSKALEKHQMLDSYKAGQIKELPEHLAKLSGAPWTIGYGETKGVKEGMVWTLEQAEKALSARVEGFLSEVLKISPKLATAAPERVAAVVSLVYNIGAENYAKSTVAKCIEAGDWAGAGNAIPMWNKAGRPLREVPGLTRRRLIEKDLFMSAR